MIEYENWCPHCRKKTGYEQVDGVLRCSVCQTPESGAVAPSDSSSSGCWKVILILFAVGLVLLAFLFAQCSRPF